MVCTIISIIKVGLPVVLALDRNIGWCPGSGENDPIPLVVIERYLPPAVRFTVEQRGGYKKGG